MTTGFYFLIQLFVPCVSQRHLHADVKTFKDEKVGNESWRCVWVKYQIKKPGYIYEPTFQWWNPSPLGPLRVCSSSASQLLLRCQVKLLTSQILNESFKYVRSYVLRNSSIRYLNTRFFSSRIISQAGVERCSTYELHAQIVSSTLLLSKIYSTASRSHWYNTRRQLICTLRWRLWRRVFRAVMRPHSLWQILVSHLRTINAFGKLYTQKNGNEKYISFA